MVLRTVAGARTGEDVDDLRAWLRTLEGGPEVTEVVALACEAHGDDRPTWFFVEADASAGTARRRCLACASTVPLLDSAERWTDPPMWACPACRQSIAEVAAGLSAPDGEHVDWVVVGARCVDCGRLDGLTDRLVARAPIGEVLGRL